MKVAQATNLVFFLWFLQFSFVIREHLLSLVGDPMLSMLDLREEDIEPGGIDTVTMLVASAKFKNNPKVCVWSLTFALYRRQ